MSELIEHDCPIEGPMMIETEKPCNWCDRLDNVDEEDDYENY
jgi:hypothetical protein